MSQGAAVVTINSVLRTTSGEANFSHATTLNNYVSDTANFATDIINNLNKIGGTVQELIGTITIDDINLATPITSSYYSTVEGPSTPVATVQTGEKEERSTFTLGSGDFSDATTLATKLQGLIAAARAWTNY